MCFAALAIGAAVYAALARKQRSQAAMVEVTAASGNGAASQATHASQSAKPAKPVGEARTLEAAKLTSLEARAKRGAPGEERS